MLSKPDMVRYEATILEVVRRMRARDFSDNYLLAAAFNRSHNWASHMREVIVRKRKLMTSEEWIASFTSRHTKKVRWACPECGSRTARVPLMNEKITKPVKQTVTPTKEEKINGQSETKPARARPKPAGSLSKPAVYEHTKNLKWNRDPLPRLPQES